MLKLISNQNYIACVIAVLAFVMTADKNFLRDSINYGLQAVLDAKNN
ncbi:hypothetical protein [Pantoea coffeiphila]|nr:hypothetical protein [Pantoea coffeiphila]